MPAFGLNSGGAYVIIVCVTGIIWTLQSIAIRLFIRLKLHGPISWDDVCCIVATILAIIHSCIAIIGTCFGLGKRQTELSDSTINKQRTLAYTANQFYIASLCFSMLSISFLIARVTKRTKQVRCAYGISLLTGLWAVTSMFYLAFDCKLPRPWDHHPRSRCHNIYHIWTGITISESLLEVANTIAAVRLLYSVRIPWRAKAAVLAAFTIRLLVIPPSLTRLHYINQTIHSKDWSYSRTKVTMITQIVLHVSIILATVPCIKPWLVAFESGGLQAHAEARKVSAAPQHHHHSRRTPGPSPLSSPFPSSISVPRPSSSLLRKRSTSHASDPIFTPGRAGHRARVEAWPLHTYREQTRYSVTAEYAPELSPLAPTYQPMLRKASKDSAASGIIRTKSFSVQHDDVEDYFGEVGRREGGAGDTIDEEMERGEEPNMLLQDVGGLLEQVEPQVERSVGTAEDNR